MKKHLIVLDFLYQKYEIEYEENMSPQKVIRKIQPYLFPCEQNDDYFSSQNEETCAKFGLYRSDVSNCTGAEFVKEEITPEQCDYTKHQFYIFRPFINVYLTIYVVLPRKLDKQQSKACLKLIYPIKKKVKLLKNYLKKKLLKLTENKKQFKDCPINGFSLQFTSDSQSKYKSYELTDEEYIEQSMNGEELFLIIRTENSISQNFFMSDRFYYILYDPSSNKFSKETESLEETKGFKLDDARSMLIKKHLENKNFLEENVLITFNSVMQTDKFDKLDDLFCDNDFYKFVVIFETSEININSRTSQYDEKIKYNIPIPDNGRPNIIYFEIEGEPKRELTQIKSAHSNKNGLNQTIEENNQVIINTNNALKTGENNNETNHVQIESHEIIHNNYSNEENVEPFIEEEEEEINENEDIINEVDEEKLLDMFCFYFSRFSKEKQLSEKKTPNPTYFKNLSNEEINLLNTFKKYYHFYRQSNH